MSTDTIQKEKGGEIPLLPQKPKQVVNSHLVISSVAQKRLILPAHNTGGLLSASPLGHISISTPASPSKQAHHFSSTTSSMKLVGWDFVAAGVLGFFCLLGFGCCVFFKKTKSLKN